jgi:hypothetical protein
VRHERSLPHTATIAGVLNLMPKAVIGAIMERRRLLASNVPGVPVPMWLEGQRIVRFFPFGPTAGSAVNITLMSYNGVCCIGVNSDSAAIPDPDTLLDCLKAGFAEVCAEAPRKATRPNRRESCPVRRPVKKAAAKKASRRKKVAGQEGAAKKAAPVKKAARWRSAGQRTVSGSRRPRRPVAIGEARAIRGDGRGLLRSSPGPNT